MCRREIVVTTGRETPVEEKKETVVGHLLMIICMYVCVLWG